MSAEIAKGHMMEPTSSEEYELESRSEDEAEEPLLPTISDNASLDRPRAVIDSWAIACLLLQHVSRSVS